MPYTPPVMPANAPTTKAQWQAEALWHLAQANDILHRVSVDASVSASGAGAHARAGQAILQAIDTKLIT